jgi:hypothetical protein
MESEKIYLLGFILGLFVYFVCIKSEGRYRREKYHGEKAIDMLRMPGCAKSVYK